VRNHWGGEVREKELEEVSEGKEEKNQKNLGPVPNPIIQLFNFVIFLYIVFSAKQLDILRCI